MGASDWLALVSAVIAGVALGVSVVSVVFAKRQADAAAEANRISRTANDIARRQLDVMREQLDADAAAGAVGRTSVVPYVPPWRIDWYRGSTFTITNGGSATERDVRIIPPDNCAVASGLEFGEIGPMSSRTFMIVPTMATESREMTVTWMHDGGPRSLTTVLPSRGS